MDHTHSKSITRAALLAAVIIAVILSLLTGCSGTYYVVDQPQHNCELMERGQHCLSDHSCCESRDHSVVIMDRVSSSPWLAKIGAEFYTAKYLFTVDYTNNEIADDPAQHKQSHVLYITEDCEWKGNLIALPNNRVRATSPALWVTGEGPPDFKPSQWAHSAEGHESYLDPSITFNNLYEK